jgi:hypothetical protein
VGSQASGSAKKGIDEICLHTRNSFIALALRQRLSKAKGRFRFADRSPARDGETKRAHRACADLR